MDMSVTSINLLNGRVSFNSSIRPQKITGVYKLVQKCVLWVLRGINTDVFNIPSGGNYLSLIGVSLDPNNIRYVTNKLTSYVQKAEEEILLEQSNNENLPDSERLSSMTLESIRVIPEETKIEVDIRVVPMSGTDIPVIIPIGI